MDKCYISGKITGTNDYVERFLQAEMKVRNLGFEPINPVKVNSELPSDTSWLDYMVMSIIVMTRSDVRKIYMLKGWENSKGAIIEHNLAKGAGYEIIYE